MIRVAAVCPQPPLLFRELAGLRDAAYELRTACIAAAQELLAARHDVVVLGGAAVSRSWDPAIEPRPEVFGGPRSHRDTGLPLSLGIGARLLAEAGWTGPVELRSVAWDASASEVDRLGRELAARERDVALLVLGDGSARRGRRAPGYVDERAFGFDEQTGRALADGDPEALLGQDASLAGELLAGGRAALQVMAAAVRAQGSRPKAELSYQGDPFGVMYFVATWWM